MPTREAAVMAANTYGPETGLTLPAGTFFVSREEAKRFALGLLELAREDSSEADQDSLPSHRGTE